MHRYSASADNAKPKRGASREYITLVSEDLTEDTSSVGALVIRDNPEEMETMDNM